MISYFSKSKSSSNQIFGWILKAGILFFMGWILVVQVLGKNELTDLMAEFHASLAKKGSWPLLLIAVGLVPMNWFLESKKWKLLVNTFQTFSLKQAIFSVLAGVSVAIMTPGRIGEYGGRLIGIKKDNQPKALLANLISSISQNIVTVGVGLIGALIFMQMFMPMHQVVFLSLILFSTVFISLMLLVYFRIEVLSVLLKYLPDWNWLSKIKDSIAAFRDVNMRSLCVVLGISLMRYLTFMTQYVVLLHFFGVTEDIMASILGVITIFFLQSNLPLPPALSVLARGEMAIFLWSVFTSNVLGIIAASFLLWLINLVIPAIFGTIIISQSKIFEG